MSFDKSTVLIFSLFLITDIQIYENNLYLQSFEDVFLNYFSFN